MTVTAIRLSWRAECPIISLSSIFFFNLVAVITNISSWTLQSKRSFCSQCLEVHYFKQKPFTSNSIHWCSCFMAIHITTDLAHNHKRKGSAQGPQTHYSQMTSSRAALLFTEYIFSTAAKEKIGRGRKTHICQNAQRCRQALDFVTSSFPRWNAPVITANNNQPSSLFCHWDLTWQMQRGEHRLEFRTYHELNLLRNIKVCSKKIPFKICLPRGLFWVENHEVWHRERDDVRGEIFRERCTERSHHFEWVQSRVRASHPQRDARDIFPNQSQTTTPLRHIHQFRLSSAKIMQFSSITAQAYQVTRLGRRTVIQTSFFYQCYKYLPWRDAAANQNVAPAEHCR